MTGRCARQVIMQLANALDQVATEQVQHEEKWKKQRISVRGRHDDLLDRALIKGNILAANLVRDTDETFSAQAKQLQDMIATIKTDNEISASKHLPLDLGSRLLEIREVPARILYDCPPLHMC